MIVCYSLRIYSTLLSLEIFIRPLRPTLELARICDDIVAKRWWKGRALRKASMA